MGAGDPIVSMNLSFDFSDDRPITDKQYDRLSRAAFAERIAEVLSGLPRGNSLVVGIHGPWGDGKTSVLNLLRTELSNDRAVVVRDFNPWRLTNDEAIFRGFFTMLADAIGASLSTKPERLRERLAEWVRRARWVTRIVGVFSKPGESLDKLLARFCEVAARGDSVALEELRRRIVVQLGKSVRRIVVLIDDLDRLDRDETHMMFRLIKACADFPNLCYVVAFDDVAVAKALGKKYGVGDELSGRAFIEKIIQVPLKLPVAAKEDLRALCLEWVDRALTAAGIELSKDEVGEFIVGFDRGVSVRLDTPRAAKRYANGLMFALPMLKGETNPVDLLFVEALRAFFPEVYDVVRDNHSHFSGVEEDPHKRGDNSCSAQLLKPLLVAMPPEDSEAVKALLVDLFPRLSVLYGHAGSYGSDWLPRWSRERRVCAPSYCARYFSYAVPRNDVPDAEVTAILDAAINRDVAEVESRLTAHLVGQKARRLIEKLRAMETEIDSVAAETLAVSIGKLGKSIPNPPALFSPAEPPSQAAILISHLLERIPSRADRIEAAKRVMRTAEPLWFGVECIRWMHVTDKPEKQDSNTLTKQEAIEVRQVLAGRIKARAADGAPLFDTEVPQERSLLFEWWQAEGRGPVQAHLIGVFDKDPKQVGLFLQSQAPLIWGMSDVLPRVGDLRDEHLKTIKLVIDLDVLAEYVRRCCPGDFENPKWRPDGRRSMEQQLAEQFMFLYNKWKTSGEPPDASGENVQQPG